MELTAKEIISDMLSASNGEVGLKLYGARYMLEKFFHIFRRKGVADLDCLYEILSMDIDQARDFLASDSNTNNERASLDPAICEKAGQTLAVLQMVIHIYLSEQIANSS
jgi:hypothetical protein